MKIKSALIGMLLPSVFCIVASAKVGDFNNMIKETLDSQKELHNNLSNNIETTRLAVRKESEQVIVDSDSSTINAPTVKDVLKFEKEKKAHKASRKKQDERLAQELKEEELNF